MAAQINYGLVNPAVLDYAGQTQKELNVQKTRMDVERLENERKIMFDFQKQLAAKGIDTDLNFVFDTMIKTGNPDYVAKGLEGKSKLQEQMNYAKVMGYDMTPPAAAPATGAPMGAPAAAPAPGTQPVNALVPMAGAQPTPAAPVNALAGAQAAPDQAAVIQNRINGLLRLGTPQALNTAKVLQTQLTALEPTPAIREYKFGQKDPAFTEYQLKKARAGATQVNMGGQPEFIKQLGKDLGSEFTKEFTATSNSAQSAAENLPKLYDTLNLINSSDAITGIGSEVLKNVERVKTQFLADKKAGKKVSDTEVLDAMLGSDVFPMIQSLGVGAKGMDTPAEREFLRGVMTGTTALDKDTLKRMTEIRVNLAKRAIEKYNANVSSGRYKPVETAQGAQLPRIDIPEFKGGAAPIFAINPATGERLQSTDNGNTWKPVAKGK
jgi:hypothetical protein